MPERGDEDEAKDRDTDVDLREVIEEVIELLDPPVTREGADLPPR